MIDTITSVDHQCVPLKEVMAMSERTLRKEILEAGEYRNGKPRWSLGAFRPENKAFSSGPQLTASN